MIQITFAQIHTSVTQFVFSGMRCPKPYPIGIKRNFWHWNNPMNQLCIGWIEPKNYPVIYGCSYGIWLRERFSAFLWHKHRLMGMLELTHRTIVWHLFFKFKISFYLIKIMFLAYYVVAQCSFYRKNNSSGFLHLVDSMSTNWRRQTTKSLY